MPTAFTNRRAHPAIDLYAVEGMRLIGRWLPRAIADGGDREARAAGRISSVQTPTDGSSDMQRGQALIYSFPAPSE